MVVDRGAGAAPAHADSSPSTRGPSAGQPSVFIYTQCADVLIRRHLVFYRGDRRLWERFWVPSLEVHTPSRNEQTAEITQTIAPALSGRSLTEFMTFLHAYAPNRRSRLSYPTTADCYVTIAAKRVIKIILVSNLNVIV